jgi:rSAM/selenodomain-associated transferase 1
MKFPHSRIMVFAKAPEPGSVKTRLIPLLGRRDAARLHARFVHNTLAMACGTGLAPVELWCSPSVAARFFRDCARRFDIMLHQQAPGDLGQRMDRAMHDTLACSRSAVLVGADCPGLCAADLAEALAALERGTDAVLGPSRDGGYYLVGLRHPNPHLFAGLEWGSATIFDDTVKRLAERDMDYHCLTEREDIDNPEDYQRLVGQVATVAEP